MENYEDTFLQNMHLNLWRAFNGMLNKFVHIASLCACVCASASADNVHKLLNMEIYADSAFDSIPSFLLSPDMTLI